MLTKTQRLIVYPILGAFLLMGMVGAVIGHGGLLFIGFGATFLGCLIVEATLLK